MLTDEEYREWRANPATEAVMRYLRDFRAHLLDLSKDSFHRAMQDSWGPDRVQQQALLQTEFSSKAQVLEDIVNLEHSAIKEFYDSRDNQ